MAHANGMDWIRLPKRMAIYHRDGFDCAYCRLVFPLDPLGYGLTLDHVEGPLDHRPENLVTACTECNKAKDTDTLEHFIQTRGLDRAVLQRVGELTSRPLDMVEGRRLAALRRPNGARTIRA